MKADDLQSKGKTVNLESLTILKVMNDDHPEDRVPTASMKSLQKLTRRERYKKLAKISNLVLIQNPDVSLIRPLCVSYTELGRPCWISSLLAHAQWPLPSVVAMKTITKPRGLPQTISISGDVNLPKLSSANQPLLRQRAMRTSLP